MFRLNNNEISMISDFIEKKSKLLHKKSDLFFSKIDQVIHGQHEHYFSKQDVLTENQNARCMVCGMLLSEFKVQQKINTLAPLLKPRRKPSTKSK